MQERRAPAGTEEPRHLQRARAPRQGAEAAERCLVEAAAGIAELPHAHAERGHVVDVGLDLLHAAQAELAALVHGAEGAAVVGTVARDPHQEAEGLVGRPDRPDLEAAERTVTGARVQATSLAPRARRDKGSALRAASGDATTGA